MFGIFLGHAHPTPRSTAAKHMGIEVMRVPGTDDSTIERLTTLFKEAGFKEIESRIIDVTRVYPNFDDYWDSQTPRFSPLTAVIVRLSETDRVRLKANTRASLLERLDGTISVTAPAHAMKARAP